MERRGFEDSTKKAFADAEVTPSANAWNAIELELEKARGVQLGRRVAFYQTLAAASVIFAVGFSIGIYSLNNKDTGTQSTDAQTAVATPSEPVTPSFTTPATTDEIVAGQPAASNSSAQRNPIGKPMAPEDEKKLIASNDETRQSAPFSEGIFSPLKERALPKLVDLRGVQLQIRREPAEPDPVALMLARLEQREKEVRGDKDRDEKSASKNENLWSSVGFAAGSFTAINAGVAAQPSSLILAQNSPLANKQAKASGLSYSMGVNLGSKISDRWVIQGGVNILSQSSDFTAQNAIQNTNTSTFKPASIGQLDKLPKADFFSNEKLISTAPYTVNSNIRYLTIPVQAGYLVLDKDFALQVSAGVATDLFLQNTLSTEGGNIDRTTEGGDDTPYRQVNLSGLAGTELSYKFGRNYRISLNPGLRYPFNSIYKSDVDVKASPLTFDIGLRFRYIFH